MRGGHTARVLLALSFALIIVMGTCFVLPEFVQPASATGGPIWNGNPSEHSLFVPIFWCVLQGSNAGTSPVPIPVNGDNNVNTILWRRHERATDNIYVPQALISFRSAFEPSATGFDFPRLIHYPPGFDGQAAHLGQVLSPDRDSQADVNRVTQKCREAWHTQNPSDVGIYAVNIKEYVDNSGNPLSGTSVLLGRAGFTFGCTSSPCTINTATSYNGGFVTLVDNANSNPVSNLISRDPRDQLFGHEVGHALALEDNLPGADSTNHNPNTANLMYRTQQGTPVSNTLLSVDEQTLARRIAKLVPNVQQDPPSQFLNNDIVGYQQPDAIEENASVPPYLDLSSIHAQLNTNTSEITFAAEVFGNISSTAAGLHYWVLANSDNNVRTGAGLSALNAIGVPQTNFTGADFVARLDVDNLTPSGQVWTMQNGALTELTDSNLYRISIGTTVSTLDYATDFATIPFCEPDGHCPPPRNTPNTNTLTEHKTVSISLNNELVNVPLDRPFSIQAFSVGTDRNGNIVVDDINSLGSKRPFILSYPAYPHCFPQSDGVPGGSVSTQVNGLLPDSPIHALLGPIVVANGTTDTNGNATIDLPIPSNDSVGTNLITVGIDDTALTADCNVQLVQQQQPGTEATTQGTVTGSGSAAPVVNVGDFACISSNRGPVGSASYELHFAATQLSDNSLSGVWDISIFEETQGHILQGEQHGALNGGTISSTGYNLTGEITFDGVCLNPVPTTVTITGQCGSSEPIVNGVPDSVPPGGNPNVEVRAASEETGSFLATVFCSATQQAPGGVAPSTAPGEEGGVDTGEGGPQGEATEESTEGSIEEAEEGELPLDNTPTIPPEG